MGKNLVLLLNAVKTTNTKSFLRNCYSPTSVCAVRNGVASALYDRILEAHQAGATFRVFVLLPLLPAFEGDIAGESGSGMRAIMYYQVN